MATPKRRQWPRIGKKWSRQVHLPLIRSEHLCQLQLDLNPKELPSASQPSREPNCIELSETEFEELVQRLELNQLTPEDRQLLRQIVQAVLWMGEELEQKKLSIQRLRRLFGVKTESLSKLFPQEAPSDAEPSAPADGEVSGQAPAPPPPVARGHGR